MLSEVLFAHAGSSKESKGDRLPGLSCSQLFPCPYYLLKVHLGEALRETPDPRQLLNMADGWDQEEQSVKRLAKAGVRIENRQAKVLVGKSQVPGSIDGTYTISNKMRLWEHKAWDDEYFYLFTRRGLDGFPGQKAQVNAYMLGSNLTEVDFFIKCKRNNDYFDKVYPLDEEFIGPIIDWCDKIRLEGWIPEPVECKWCTHCGIGCFGAVLDFSWMGTAKAEDIAEKWKQGDKYVKVGEMLKEEARTYFVGKKDKYGNTLVEGIMGDRELLLVEDLEIRKVIQNRFDVNKGRVLEVFGAEGLMQVGEEKEIVTYRFREV